MTDRTHKNAPWQARLAGLTLGTPRRRHGLCLYPLLGDDLTGTPYILLDAALASGALTIEEKGAGGSVPELHLTNKGADRVLLLDGEELIGAKQNRIVNTSVLVDVHSSLLLPVTCVEAGRWRQDTARFASGGSHYNARGRQKKVVEVSASLAWSERPAADQSRVWSDVQGKLNRMEVSSDTSALHEATRVFQDDLSAYAEHLGTAAPRQVGAAFALGRELVGLDLFDRAETLKTVLPKLVASYAIDALEERRPEAAPPASVLEEWLAALAKAAARTHRAVGLGEDVRLSAPRISGAALEVEGVALHLSAFHTLASEENAAPATRFVRASQRRSGERQA